MVNKIIILGRCGRVDKKDNLTKFSLAVNEKYKDETRTEWFECVCFGKLAGLAAEYVEKGKQYYVEGKLRTDEYTDKEGVTKKSVSVIVNQLVFI